MKPHLACDADIDKMKFPCWGFPKIDGVRLLNIEGNALARSLKPHECKFITNKYSNDLFAGFDGELTVGETTADDVLNKTSSATRTINWKGILLGTCLTGFLQRHLGNILTRNATITL